MWLHARGPQFLVGMLCAEALLVPRHPVSTALVRWGRDAVACLAVAGAAYLLATTAVTGPLTVAPADGSRLLVRSALCTLVALCLLLPLTMGTHSLYASALTHPWIRWFGVIAYGLFLWHLPVFAAIYEITDVPEFSGGLLPLLAVGLPTTIGLAALSHYWIEVPASRLVGRILRRRQRQDERADHEEPDQARHQ